MALDPPKFPQAQCVMTFAGPALRERSRDDAIVQTLEHEFPNVISRPFGTSNPTAPIVLATGPGPSAAQLSIGPAQAEFGVGFAEGRDLEGVIDYLGTKLGTIVTALNGADVRVLTAGVVLVVQFSFGVDAAEAVLGQLLETQIRHDVSVDDVADVLVRLGLKVSDTHYVSLTVSNYETRNFQGVASLASPFVSIRPWEGEVSDRGIQLVIDVNNRLAVQQAAADSVLDPDGMHEILRVVRAVAAQNGPTFVETGRVTSGDIEATLGAA